jgi:hypothetical protein
MPLIKHSCSVTYSSPKTANAFEIIILEMFTKLSGLTEYSEMTLPELFQTILGVTDVNLFIEDSVSRLISGDFLRCPEGIQDPLAIKLSQFEKTERCSLIVSTGKIPGVATKVNIDSLFDPIRHQLVKKSKYVTYKNEPTEPYIDAKLFEQTELSEVIKNSLRDRKLDWYKKDTQIESIDEIGRDSLYQDSQVDVVWVDSRITFKSHDDKVTGYLNSITTNAAKNILAHAIASYDKSPSNNDLSDLLLKSNLPNPAIIESVESFKDFIAKTKKTRVLIASASNQVSSIIPVQSIKILLTDDPIQEGSIITESGSLELTNHDGCLQVFVCPRARYLGEIGIRSYLDSKCIMIAMYPVEIGSGTIDLPLALTVSAQNDDLQKKVHHLVASHLLNELKSGDFKTGLYLLFIDKTNAVKEAIERIRSNPTPDELISTFRDMARSHDNEDESNNSARKYIESQIRSCSYRDCIEYLCIISKLFNEKPEKLVLSSQYLKDAQPKNLDQFGDLYDVLVRHSIPITNDLLSWAIIERYLNRESNLSSKTSYNMLRDFEIVRKADLLYEYQSKIDKLKIDRSFTNEVKVIVKELENSFGPQIRTTYKELLSRIAANGTYQKAKEDK